MRREWAQEQQEFSCFHGKIIFKGYLANCWMRMSAADYDRAASKRRQRKRYEGRLDMGSINAKNINKLKLLKCFGCSLPSTWSGTLSALFGHVFVFLISLAYNFHRKGSIMPHISSHPTGNRRENHQQQWMNNEGKPRSVVRARELK